MISKQVPFGNSSAKKLLMPLTAINACFHINVAYIALNACFILQSYIIYLKLQIKEIPVIKVRLDIAKKFLKSQS